MFGLFICSVTTIYSLLCGTESVSLQGCSLWRWIWLEIPSGIKGGNSDREARTCGDVVLDT